MAKENQKLRQLVQVLRSNLNTSEENLKRSLQDSRNSDKLLVLNLKNKSLEQKLLETEKSLRSTQLKVQTLSKDLKSLQIERNELKESIEEKEMAAENYRTMRTKAIELIVSLFSEEPPKTLNLRYMEIENSFINVIYAILKKYPSIEIIDLEGNYLDDQGAKMLADLICNSDSQINEFNLNYNKISAEGAWQLMQSIKLREDTKFKKIKKINLQHTLIDKPADIYLKMWDCFKPIRDAFPQNKIKASELRRVSNTTATKMFASTVGNIKEIQDLIDIMDRIVVSETSNSKIIELQQSKSVGVIKEKSMKVEADKYNENSKKNFSAINIMAMYNSKGELVPSNIENWIKTRDIDEIDTRLNENLLMHACRIGNLRLVKKLIVAKADLEKKNNHGENALLIACKFENFEAVNYLILCGCNLNACDLKGKKAIHIAVKAQRAHSICRLVEMGQSVDCTDFHNKTPLHYAARIGDSEIGKLLIQMGADINSIDFKGRTPAGLAEDKEHFSFADTLEKLGGKKIKGYEDVKLDPISTQNHSFYSMNDQVKVDLSFADKIYKKIYKKNEI